MSTGKDICARVTAISTANPAAFRDPITQCVNMRSLLLYVMEVHSRERAIEIPPTNVAG